MSSPRAGGGGRWGGRVRPGSHYAGHSAALKHRNLPLGRRKLLPRCGGAAAVQGPTVQHALRLEREEEHCGREGQTGAASHPQYAGCCFSQATLRPLLEEEHCLLSASKGVQLEVNHSVKVCVAHSCSFA